MRIRTGFVSNSSTSSYVCNICEEVIAGYDISWEEWEIGEYECGHFFHDGCVKRHMGEKEKKEFDKFLTGEHIPEEDEDERYELRYTLPKKYCPICNLKHITDEMIVAHLLERCSISRDEVCDEIRGKNKDK